MNVDKVRDKYRGFPRSRNILAQNIRRVKFQYAFLLLPSQLWTIDDICDEIKTGLRNEGYK